MSISLSPEAEAKAQQIPDISARLERFIQDQFELEQWRSRRAKPDVAAVVEDGLRAGAALRASGADRVVMFERLQALTERLSHGR
ncbi:MAG: hypothetical protein NT013_21010 [Planctomycetia bacterium]|nr:hypothetical protein [Planctomycetia bacterium]